MNRSPKCALALIAFGAALALIGCQTQNQKKQSSTGIEEVPVEYHSVRERLDRQDKNAIITLARNYGITEIEKLDVHYALPTDNRIIVLREKGVIDGRIVHTRVLRIDCVKWNTPVDDSPEATKQLLNGAMPARAGGFRVVGDSVEVQRILRIEGNELRIHVDESISTELAEEIVGKILKADIVRDRFDTLIDRLKEAIARGDKLTSLKTDGAGKFAVELWDSDSAIRFTFSRDPSSGALKIVATGYIVA